MLSKAGLVLGLTRAGVQRDGRCWKRDGRAATAPGLSGRSTEATRRMTRPFPAPLGRCHGYLTGHAGRPAPQHSPAAQGRFQRDEQVESIYGNRPAAEVSSRELLGSAQDVLRICAGGPAHGPAQPFSQDIAVAHQLQRAGWVVPARQQLRQLVNGATPQPPCEQTNGRQPDEGPGGEYRQGA